MPISGPLIKEKAKEVAREKGILNFTASNVWLEKFRTRHAINYKAICGESGSVDESVVDNWMPKVKDICKGFDLRNIFYLDETGLFFRALPDKTMCLKKEKCIGAKLS